MRFISVACFLFVASSKAEELKPQGILAVAKIAGSCGILDEMIDFQKKTKLEGGNLFVTRFWETEAARRGMTVKEMSNQCDQAILSYDEMWKSVEK